jgi:hypothetical protein
LGSNSGSNQIAPAQQRHGSFWLKRFLAQHYTGCAFRCVGDPKRRDKSQATEQSTYDVFKFNGMPVSPAPVKANDISTRIEAVAYALNDNPRGINRLVISPASAAR